MSPHRSAGVSSDRRRTMRVRALVSAAIPLVLATAFLRGPAMDRALASPRHQPPAARTIRVSSLAELQEKIQAAMAGDRIVVANGVYITTGPIKVVGKGTKDQPIVIAAETTGGVEIRGMGGFDLASPAAYVTVQGFKFTHSSGPVQVRAGATHCRLTRNVFELAGDGRYLLVSGDDCEVDHNTFQNKRTVGPMFSIHGPGASGMAQRVWVHHNLFQNFTSIGQNGGETLQIGLSGKSMTDAYSLVENNLFVKCDGENETISNKSCANIYRYNTFRDSVGELTLRHGNRCEVYGNFFFNTHGLRFFGDDHHIYSNYFEGCNPAIQIGNGDTVIPPGILTGHDRPDRVRVSFNTLVNNKGNVVMSGRTNGLGATDLVFANNLIQSDSGTALKIGGPLPNPRFVGNLVWGMTTEGDLPASSTRRADPHLTRDAITGLYRLGSTSPAVDAAIGDYPEAKVDLMGRPRSGKKDIGAEEFSGDAALQHPLTAAEVGPSAP